MEAFLSVTGKREISLPFIDLEFLRGDGDSSRPKLVSQNSSSWRLNKKDPSTRRTAASDPSSRYSSASTPVKVKGNPKVNLQSLSIPIRGHISNVTMEEVENLTHIMDSSNSIIYSGSVISSGKEVAPVIVKTMKASSTNMEAIIREFQMEKDVLSRFNHPNVVRLVSIGRIEGRAFLALEKLQGGSLGNILSENKKAGLVGSPFSFNRILEVGLSFARALNYIHYQFHDDVTIIHRDLKPDNIAFTSNGVLKLIDFGLCTAVKRRTHCEESYKMTGRVGTLRYMAPEVYQALPYTELIDVYSFALIMWQICTGLVPFGENLKSSEIYSRIVKNQERPSLLPMEVKGVEVTVPDPLIYIFQYCWNPSPQSRFNATELVETFTNLLKKTNSTSQRCGFVG